MWGLLMKLNENRTKVKSKTSTHSVSVDRIVPQVPGCLPYSDEALSKEGDTGWVELMNYCPRLENGVCYTSMKHCQKKEKQDELNWWITVPGQQKGACYTSMMHCQKKEKQDELNWWITVAGQKKGACYTSMKHCQEKETGWVELMNYCRGAEKRCVLHPWCTVKRKRNRMSWIDELLSRGRKKVRATSMMQCQEKDKHGELYWKMTVAWQKNRWALHPWSTVNRNTLTRRQIENDF